MANNVNAFIPEFYSQKLLKESKEMTDFKNNMTNSDWEGEIKSAGDTVHICTPDASNIVIGEGVVPEVNDVYPKTMTLTIDKTKSTDYTEGTASSDVLRQKGDCCNERKGRSRQVACHRAAGGGGVPTRTQNRHPRRRRHRTVHPDRLRPRRPRRRRRRGRHAALPHPARNRGDVAEPARRRP